MQSGLGRLTRVMRLAPVARSISSDVRAALALKFSSFDWAALAEEKTRFDRDNELTQHLRSDHAGETGAVWIYKGAEWALARRRGGGPAQETSKGSEDETEESALEAAASAFVSEHLETEQGHLDVIDALLKKEEQSKLLPLWRGAGWALGAAPTVLGGPRALFCTVEAVETFVEKHYMEHIVPLEQEGQYPELVKVLKLFCSEEVHHRDEAAARIGVRPWYFNAWAVVVEKGSMGAVAVCRRI